MIRRAAAAFLVSILAAPIVHAIEIPEGPSSFQWEDGMTSRPLTVWTYRPTTLAPGAKIVFVLHGMNRDGKRYRDQWQPHAEKGSFLLVAPEFDERSFTEYAYQRGNVADADGNALDESRWTFNTIEKIFDVVRAAARLRTARYSLYGHSAGAQFVHRFVLFMPDARYERAIAANAGWYTMPTFEVSFPYGLGNAPATEAGLKRAMGRDLVVILGDEDTGDSDPGLRNTDRARSQGRTRLERGETFHQTALASSRKLGVSLRWRRIVVRDAGHSNREMAAAAAALLVP
jgi:poly(3-hydroxybutyrate) depolymerase